MGMGSSKSFDIKNLLPFHKTAKGVPRSIRGEEEKIIELDPKLSPEEQMYVRHYLGYADILLGPLDELDPLASTIEEVVGEKVIEISHTTSEEQLTQDEAKEEDGNTEAA